jgi:hypothetical protein
VILFTERSQRVITSYDYNSFWRIGKYRQQFSDDSLATGFVKISSIRGATGTYDDLQIYVLGILLNRQDYPWSDAELGVQGYWINRFDNEYLKFLGPRDTLAFKEIFYRYKHVK